MSDSTPPLLKLWKKFNGSAPQRGLFSLGYALKAPYFRTVAPRVREVEPGRAVLRLGKWWGVQNHIGTFHVIAALNGAEAAMGLVCEATVPTTHRWIPRSMRADYPAKSTGGLTITATLGGELHTIRFQMLDDAGVEPVTAEIDVWITAKKPR